MKKRKRLEKRLLAFEARLSALEGQTSGDEPNNAQGATDAATAAVGKVIGEVAAMPKALLPGGELTGALDDLERLTRERGEWKRNAEAEAKKGRALYKEREELRERINKALTLTGRWQKEFADNDLACRMCRDIERALRS